MKLFPAKCPERATLRKLWRQTGNSSLLPAKCWPLLHVIRACSWRWPDFVAGIPARFSKFAFVLFCYITNLLMTGPLENSEFCFPRISMCPSTSSRETLRFSGNKIHCSSRDQSLSVYYHPHPSNNNTNDKDGDVLFFLRISLHRVFSRDFTATMLVSPTNPPGIEFYS